MDATLDPRKNGFKPASLLTVMPYLTPAIFESEGLTNRIKSPFPVRIAGRCGLR